MNLPILRHSVVSGPVGIGYVIIEFFKRISPEPFVFHHDRYRIFHFFIVNAVAHDHSLSHRGKPVDMGILLIRQRDIPLLKAIQGGPNIIQSLDYGSFVPEFRIFSIRMIRAPVLKHLFGCDRHELLKK